jgi:hypothetical protein
MNQYGTKTQYLELIREAESDLQYWQNLTVKTWNEKWKQTKINQCLYFLKELRDDLIHAR